MMPVKKDDSGRRSVQLEVELPGSPEDAWHAIATGPGISSWFVATDVDPRLGGAMRFHLAEGLESLGRVTAWEPPRRFAYEERDWAPDAPPLASEFTIEARAGSRCVVRLVHSLFASSDEWDDQLESIESGWPPFFEVLRMYLGHFAGQPCASIRLGGAVAGSEAEAWTHLTHACGLAGASGGERWRLGAVGATPLSGVVQRIPPTRLHEMLVKLDEPTAGAGLFGVYTWGTQVMLSITLYLYGTRAAGIAARDAAAWRQWAQQALLLSSAPQEDVKEHADVRYR
jgi:uncharacterized protein YndB with AHSA1/START domain